MRHRHQRGSVLVGMLVMLLLSLLLFWLPGFGALIAGVVGGKLAGGVGAALLAALLPGVVLGIAAFAFTQWLTGVRLFAWIAGLGVTVLMLMQVGMLLLGALIGGLLA